MHAQTFSRPTAVITGQIERRSSLNKPYSVALYLTSFDHESEVDLLVRISNLVMEAKELGFKVNGFNAKAWSRSEAKNGNLPENPDSERA